MWASAPTGERADVGIRPYGERADVGIRPYGGKGRMWASAPTGGKGGCGRGVAHTVRRYRQGMP